MSEYQAGRDCRPAAGLAIAVMLASGFAYRAAASRVADWFEIAELPSGALARLPVRLGNWSGEDQALDELTAGIVAADDHVRRVYKHADGRSVGLFIALRRSDVGYGVPAAELAPHRPEICYPAHGWKAGAVHTRQLSAADGSALPVEIRQFHRGELDAERVSVLTYYIVDGRRGHDVFEARSASWRPKGDVRYVAQVEVAAGGGLVAGAAEECIQDFAIDSAGVILDLVAGDTPNSGELSPEGDTGASERGG